MLRLAIYSRPLYSRPLYVAAYLLPEVPKLDPPNYHRFADFLPK